MKGPDPLQTLTLWFVALIFLQTGAGGTGNPLLAGVGLVAVALAYLLPLVLLLQAGLYLTDR
jgi:hypothetical protein